MENKIIYFGDPLCSWCYGFAEEITKVVEHFKEELQFELVMGGLRPFGTEKMSDLADMLRHHWEQVHERSGAPFRYELLKSTSFVYDTEPPSRAVVAMQHLHPTEAFGFYKDIQKAFYYDNKDTSLLETYDPLLEGRVSKEAFREAFQSEEIKKETKDMFTYSQELGVRGFPATVLLLNEQLFQVANGYMEADPLIKGIERLMQEKVVE